MNQPDNIYIANNIKWWLETEYKARGYKKKIWNVEILNNVPQQDNFCDCGVFTMMFIDAISGGFPVNSSFEQCDIPFLRLKIAADIIRGRLLYDL